MLRLLHITNYEHTGQQTRVSCMVDTVPDNREKNVYYIGQMLFNRNKPTIKFVASRGLRFHSILAYER